MVIVIAGASAAAVGASDSAWAGAAAWLNRWTALVYAALAFAWNES